MRRPWIGDVLLINQSNVPEVLQCGKRRCARSPLAGFLFVAAALSLLPHLPLRGQQVNAAAIQGNKLAPPTVEKKPPESELTFEGQGSFGNYKIFAQGEDSKLFSSGVEYDRHSWGKLLGSNVYYVAEFLPFVLLDEPADQNYYGVYYGTNHKLVPGIGISPVGFRLSWRDNKRVSPFLMAKAGFLVFSQKTSPFASYENISLQSSTGVQIRMSDRFGMRLGLGDFHFSNAFFVPSNPGLDVMSYSFGLIMQLNR